MFGSNPEGFGEGKKTLRVTKGQIPGVRGGNRPGLFSRDLFCTFPKPFGGTCFLKKGETQIFGGLFDTAKAEKFFFPPFGERGMKAPVSQLKKMLGAPPSGAKFRAN